MIQFTERFILIDFLFVSDIIKCIKKEDKSEFVGIKEWRYFIQVNEKYGESGLLNTLKQRVKYGLYFQ